MDRPGTAQAPEGRLQTANLRRQASLEDIDWQSPRQLATLDLAAIDAEELTPAERPFLRFAPDAQALFDAWRAKLEATLRSDDDHPVVVSHLAKYRSLMPSLALIVHLIDAVDTVRFHVNPMVRRAPES